VSRLEGIRKAMKERNINEGQWDDGKQWSLGVGQRRKKFLNLIQHATDHSDCQTSIRPHEIPHFGHIFVRFLTCKVFQNEVGLPHTHGHPKMLYAT